MSQETSSRFRSRRFRVDHAEEQAWVGFYKRVGNPAVATEVMQQLDADPEMKRAHLALYLRCKESLRMEKARLARNKRVGQFVRILCSALFVAPAHAIARLLDHGRDIAVECLPQTAVEPAVRHVQKLTQKSEYAQAYSAFTAEAPEQTRQVDTPSTSARAA